MGFGGAREAGLNQVEVIKQSGAETATANGSIYVPPRCSGIMFCLDVTAADDEAGDTLDVFIESHLGGPVSDSDLDDNEWVDVVHFTQVVGNGGAKTHIAKIVADQTQSMFEAASALAAGSVRHLLGYMRARWEISDSGDGDASFTFSITAVPM